MAARCIELDQGWRFHLGEAKRWHRLDHQVCYDMTKAGSEVGDMGVFLNENDWRDVAMPHDWCTQMKSDPAAMPSNGYKPRTVGWYYLAFDLPGYDADAQLLLEFEGVMGESQVYVNGTHAMRNCSGYTGFFADVSDLMRPGKNNITVRVDNRMWEGWWYEGAGIYRPVRLIVLPGVNLAHLSAFAHAERDGDAWAAVVSATLLNTTDEPVIRSVRARILNVDAHAIEVEPRQIRVAAHAEAGWRERIEITNPALWSPDEPNLYRVQIELLENGESVQIQTLTLGFRQIELTADQGMLLNGVPTRVKGICCHQDHAGVGIAVPKALNRYRIEKLKAMGCNAYRCAHNAASEDFLDLCDELGMLVMAENRHFNPSEDSLSELDSLVLRARNHPSVFLYSLFNEEPWQAEERGFRIARRMLRRIRSLDATRAVTAAMNGGALTERNASDVLDVAGMNYFIDDYMRYAAHRPGHPMVGTENGPIYATRGVYRTDPQWQVYDCYGTTTAFFGQRLEDTMEAVETAPHVAGLFMWGGFDYRGEPQPFEWPSVFSHWGFHDNCGFEKDTAFLLKSYYTNEKMLHLLPHWNWNPGETVRVCAFTNCPSVRLYLNGRLIGEKAVKRNRAEWQVAFEPGTLMAEADADGGKIVDSAATAGVPARIDLANAAEGPFADALILNVDLVDERGVHVPDDDRAVRICIEGGILLGSGNGDPNGIQPDGSSVQTTFAGRCQFIIRPNGPVRVIASSDGIPDAVYEIE